MTCSPSSAHLSSTRLICHSKKAVHKKQEPAPAAGMLFYANSGLLKFTCVVDFFSRETSTAHYNFCFQKWKYFLVLHTQSIVLRALIVEVSFLSRYNSNSNIFLQMNGAPKIIPPTYYPIHKDWCLKSKIYLFTYPGFLLLYN